jgi:hypothetical protein
MELSGKIVKVLQNGSCSVEIDLFGGAITKFCLPGEEINPLSFRLPAEQMPENNKSGAPYQGHFLCLGRWGRPSEGEINAGMPDHGQLSNILWEAEDTGPMKLEMRAFSPMEGLHVNRSIELSRNSPLYMVAEEVHNTNTLGRLYNMVQHPTLGQPFLDHATVVNCNAEAGFDHSFGVEREMYASSWPIGLCKDMTAIDLSAPQKEYSSVFSFVVKKTDKMGWVTAYSPTHNLLLGYIWKRTDYPWIILWQDWLGSSIRYRGIEFGTTGIHKSFKQIISDEDWKVFGENTCEYIDAGEKPCRKYLSFLCDVKPGFKGVNEIYYSNGDIIIEGQVSGQNIELSMNPGFDKP